MERAAARRAHIHKWLTAYPYAHRGLHMASRGIPENSMAAFEQAIDKKLGIELDARVSFDGDAVVFHDKETARLTGLPGVVAQMSAQKLGKMTLLGSDEVIPTLKNVMHMIDGQTPVLIEVKSNHDESRRVLCSAIRHALEGYRGQVAVMSFDPYILRWFAEVAPAIPRGLVLTTHHEGARGWFVNSSLAQRFMLSRAKADFIAYDLKSLPSRFVNWARGHGYPVLTWTVRTQNEANKGRSYADNIIFELTDEAPSGSAD